MEQMQCRAPVRTQSSRAPAQSPWAETPGDFTAAGSSVQNKFQILINLLFYKSMP